MPIEVLLGTHPFEPAPFGTSQALQNSFARHILERQAEVEFVFLVLRVMRLQVVRWLMYPPPACS